MSAKKQSAGILLYRRRETLEVFIGHPGGPFFVNKDEGIWSIPKGEFDDEDPYTAALREFKEEIGHDVAGEPIALTPVVQGHITQKHHKTVYAFALGGHDDIAFIESNTCEIEWPPRSGRRMQIPEIDRAEWFPVDVARAKLNPAQISLLDELESLLQDEG